MKRKIKITFNAPVVLGFAAICFIATLLNYLTNGKSNQMIFMTYHSSLMSPLTYLRLAESLNKSTDEMKDKKIPESYSEKYEKKETEPTMDINAFVDNLFKMNEKQENNILKVASQTEKRSKSIAKKIIDIDDDNFELDL